MNWLFKEEPENYSYDDLVRDGRTTWTGVRNPLAQKHLRSVAKGDQIFFYHTGKEKSVVGIMKRRGRRYPDPADKTARLYAVDVAPVRKLTKPVTLASIKADKAFATFPLVRMSRLSVMPVDDEEWARIEKMSGSLQSAGIADGGLIMTGDGVGLLIHAGFSSRKPSGGRSSSSD